jgi:hypothetical protein
MTALIMALDRAIRQENAGSKYEDEDLLVLG